MSRAAAGDNYKRVVIVGGGIAGHSACAAAMRSSRPVRVTLVNKEKHALYSACVLSDYVSGEMPRSHVFLPPLYKGEPGRPRVMKGIGVAAIDPARKAVALDNGKLLPYDSLILALGANPFAPPIEGVDLPGVFFCKTLDDADALRRWRAKRATVIGAGPIGLEVAMALQARGMKVSVVEALDRPLAAILDAQAAGIVTERILEAGIELILPAKVLRVMGNQRVEAVATESRTIETDLVVLAAGMRPNVEIASRAGIEIGSSRAIRTGPDLRTSDPNIWACGDCAESIDMLSGLTVSRMLWPNAMMQGQTAGANATGGGEAPCRGSISCTAVDLFGKGIFSFGSTAQSLPGCSVFEKRSSKGHISFVMKDKQLAGVQAVGNDIPRGIASVLFHRDLLASPKAASLKRSLRFRIPYANELMEMLKSDSISIPLLEQKGRQ